MLAILGGFGAALVFAAATLCNSRSSRMIGPSALLAWVMLLGLAIVAPLVALEGVPEGLGGDDYVWLGLAGLGNVVGLLLAYAALRAGKVGVVAPIVSTQGAIAAVIAVIAGESIAPAAGVLLAMIAVGIFLASIASEPENEGSLEEGARRGAGRVPALALGAALAIGVSLYAIGRVSVELPVVWALLPSRVLGVAVVTLPLLLTSGLTMTRPALPLVVAAGIAEVAGFALFALGARHGIAISAVLASQFAAIAAVAAYVLFRERMTRVQVAGAVVVAAGVGALAGVQA